MSPEAVLKRKCKNSRVLLPGTEGSRTGRQRRRPARRGRISSAAFRCADARGARARARVARPPVTRVPPKNAADLNTYALSIDSTVRSRRRAAGAPGDVWLGRFFLASARRRPPRSAAVDASARRRAACASLTRRSPGDRRTRSKRRMSARRRVWPRCKTCVGVRWPWCSGDAVMRAAPRASGLRNCRPLAAVRRSSLVALRIHKHTHTRARALTRRARGFAAVAAPAAATTYRTVEAPASTVVASNASPRAAARRRAE